MFRTFLTLKPTLSHPNLSAISSYCFLLIIGFDAIFADSWLLKCLFLIQMSIFMLILLFSLSNFLIVTVGVRNVG
jgi:hypothetical protein